MIVKDTNDCVRKDSFVAVLFMGKLDENPCKLVKFQMYQGAQS